MDSKAFTESFMDLLAARFNIHDDIEPDTPERGKIINDTALDLAQKLCEIRSKSGGHAEGVEIVVRLMSEVLTAPDMASYMEEETRRGWNGESHEFNGKPTIHNV